MSRYAAYMQAQVRELLTGYGPIDIIWYDFSYPGRDYRGLPGKGHDDWQSEQLYALTRELQPNIIINNRLDLPAENADIYTPEQFQPREWVHVDGQPVVWETCQTFSGSWGYHRDETTWKSPEQLIQMLINSVACGGNLLMNVGLNWARPLRRAGHAGAEGVRGLGAAAWPRDLRLHAERAERAIRAAALRSRATACMCMCSTGRSGTCTWMAWPARWPTRSC